MNNVMPVPLMPTQSAELDRDYIYHSLHNIALHQRVWDSISARICYLDSLKIFKEIGTSNSVLSIEFADYEDGSKKTEEKRRMFYRAYACIKKNFIKLESDLNQYLESYAKASCRALCDDIQQKLPCELRDDIYERIIDYPTHLGFRVEEKCLKLAETGHGRTELVKSWVFDDYAHLCDPDYISLETMREFAEIWYRVVKFDLVRHSPINSVPEFFKHDLWGLHLQVHDLVRRVEVNGLDARRGDNLDFLRCLLNLNRLAKIRFDFSAAMSLGRDREKIKQIIVEAASKLFPLMKELLDAGYKLSATFASIDWVISKEILNTQE